MAKLYILFLSASLAFAADPPALTDKARLEYAEARAARLQAQAVYDALPAQIKKLVEDAIQAVNGAEAAVQNAVRGLAAECGPNAQPFQDAKAGLICASKPIVDSPPQKP